MGAEAAEAAEAAAAGAVLLVALVSDFVSSRRWLGKLKYYHDIPDRLNCV